MYKNKYLKYKNKYLDLKNKKGGSAMGGEPNDYESNLDDLLNNDNDSLILLSKLKRMCELTLQRHKDVPISDKILMKLFTIKETFNLSSLLEDINIFIRRIDFYKSNPESIFDILLSDFQFYNTKLSKFHDLINLKVDDELKIKNIKCLIKSIKDLKKIDKNMLLSPKFVKEKNEAIESHRLFNILDRAEFDKCMEKYSTLVPTVKISNPQTQSHKTFFDGLEQETHNLSEPHFAFYSYHNNHLTKALEDNHFNLSSIPNKKCSIKKYEYFLENFHRFISDIDNCSLNIQHVSNFKPADRLSDIVRKTIYGNNDIISFGCIETKGSDGVRISLNIKWPIIYPTDICIINSDSSDILRFISKSKSGSSNNFVKDRIERDPSILLDDEYEYDFNERIDIEAFKVYRIINNRIYTLLKNNSGGPTEDNSEATTEDNSNDQPKYSCITCPDCRINTISKDINIACSSCNLVYCRKCSKREHPDLGCNEKPMTADDRKYFYENMTKCPKCRTPITRAGACIHMTCSKCNTPLCHLCGQLWNNQIGFGHLWDCLCPEINKYPKIVEYMPILRRTSGGPTGPAYNLSKPQLRAIQDYPKLLQHLIDTKESIIVVGSTPKDLEALKQRYPNSSPTGNNSSAGGGGP